MCCRTSGAPLVALRGPSPAITSYSLARVLLWLAFVLLVAAPMTAQPSTRETPIPPDPTGSAIAPSPGAGMYVGPASCASSNCHGATEPREVFDVLQNEYLTWLQRDAHSGAAGVLFEQDSRTIAANLGLERPPHEAQECLACHAFTPPPSRTARAPLELEDGISCEACHGPAGGWLGTHTEEGWTTDDGVETGLVDLSDPARRGRLCLSCHRGEGERVVDHRLLAAGHPQLVFELDNFSARMPRHWRPEPAEEVVRTWAVGQAVALERELELVASSAAASTAAQGRWPELSLMSCTDCHHSLAEERWRGRSGRRDPLGLPRWSPARWAVLRVVVARVAPEREAPLAATLEPLAAAVSRLGTPAGEAAEAARRVREPLAAARQALERASWGPRRVRALMLDLARDREGLTVADRASAEGTALALNTLAAALAEGGPGRLPAGAVDALEVLYRTLQEPHSWDRSGFVTALERLAESLEGGF